MPEEGSTKFNMVSRYEPSHVRAILSNVRGSELSDSTWKRMLRHGRVSADEDQKYGPDELAHLIELTQHLLRGGTYKQFEQWKFGDGQPFNPVDLDVEYEVVN